MGTIEAVRKATRIALNEAAFSAEPLSALRFANELPHAQRARARAAVDAVYRTGRAPYGARATARKSQRAA